MEVYQRLTQSDAKLSFTLEEGAKGVSLAQVYDAVHVVEDEEEDAYIFDNE